MRRTAAVVWLLPALAVAEPCGDVPNEGRCDGKTRLYCASVPGGHELKSEECETCCGWQGQRYACLDSCPDGCIDECKDGPDVFGCSLLNTHQFTCQATPEGCTRRVYVACGEDEICDEADTHACRPTSEVDLCGGVPAGGVCQGHVFKRCVAGAIDATDCAAVGQGCAPGGCTAECTPACLEGQSGCLAGGQAWSCVPDAVTGCLVQVGKNCGAKTCYEGKCVFQDEIPSEEPEVVEEVADAGAAAPPASTGSCLMEGEPDEGMTESTLAVLATLLGLLLFLVIARRRDDGSGSRSERGAGGEDGAPADRPRA